MAMVTAGMDTKNLDTGTPNLGTATPSLDMGTPKATRTATTIAAVIISNRTSAYTKIFVLHALLHSN